MKIEVSYHPEDGVGTLIDSPQFRGQIQPHVRTGAPTLNLRTSTYGPSVGLTLESVDELIALLQRARAEMLNLS